ncbi:MAG: hypothetical protein MK165_21515, partial [Pirellulaceae bacterium]|nr:hypothetical protein [Pirellulaceae bacterium]
ADDLPVYRCRPTPWPRQLNQISGKLFPPIAPWIIAICNQQNNLLNGVPAMSGLLLFFDGE